jgi:acetyltransferase
MLNKLFSPKSVAVIGASREKGKLGYTILANILKYGYRSQVYPVNPKGGKILNLKCYESVLQIKKSVDLAVVVIPAAVVPAVLQECGQKQIPNVIIVSAGFKEVGGNGVELEAKTKAIAASYKINILGPNCLGVLDSVSKLNASFADGMISRGKVAFFSQSGAICTAMLDWAKLHQLGFSRFISLGNKAGITENDLLEFLQNDRETEVVLGYLEGIADGRNFLEICREVVKKKPVIILKAGRSAAGQKAISSHTGSLAGSDEVIDAAFKQAGVIRANSLGELFSYAKLFSSQPLIKGNSVAIVANAGGPSVMTTDFVAQSNLKIVKFSPATLRQLKKKLPPAAAIHNPVDVVGDARADRYQVALETVLADKNVRGVIVLLTPQTVTEVTKTAQVMVAANKKYSKPMVASFIGGEKVQPGVDILNKNNISTYQYPEEAAQALSAMAQYRKTRKQKNKKTRKQLTVIEKKIWQKIQATFSKTKGQVEWSRAEEILKAYQIPLVNSGVAKNSAAAVRLAKKFGYPLAMKVVAKKLIHKTDAGGVAINLKTPEEVLAAYRKLNRVAKKFKGQILVQPMIKGAKEIILGAKNDPQFGPIVMFGLGGVYVEVLKDVTFRVAPITQAEALTMISEIKAFKLLQGQRGEKAIKLSAIAEVLVKLSELVIDFPQIQEMDINPLMATANGCQVVDVRIMV